MPHQERSQEMQTCIDNCQSCHAVCLETISHCLDVGGKHADAKHIALLQDCVQICTTSADFMLRASDYNPQVCGVCANICNACADSCESLSEASDDFMARCAEACRRCAESCRSMSGSAKSASSM